MVSPGLLSVYYQFITWMNDFHSPLMTSCLRSSPGESAEADRRAGQGGGLELVRNSAELSLAVTGSGRSLSCDVPSCRYDVLSPGEMQRLSFARLFYLQPKYAGVSLCWCGCVHMFNVFMKSTAARRRRGLTAVSDLIAAFSNLDLKQFAFIPLSFSLLISLLILSWH